MKSHMGIFTTIGKGGTYTSSCKQKLNAKSSTEAKLVAINDAMVKSNGQDISWLLRVYQYPSLPYTKTKRALSYYQRMEKHPVGLGKNNKKTGLAHKLNFISVR